MSKRILITGGAGFIGHHLVNHILLNTDWDILIIDKLTYASTGFNRLRDINIFDDKRVKVFTFDFNQEIKEGLLSELGKIDYIVHLGAETHVDNSIINPEPFVLSNVIGTMRLLDLARKVQPNKMLYFSCYDKKTRAITKDGLKYYNELKKGDSVLTLNEKREAEFQPIEKVMIQEYNGDMVKIGGNASLLVTPNHRMYNNKMNVCEASEILNRFDFPKSEGTANKDRETINVDGLGDINSDDLMYITGVFIGDGFTAYQKQVIKNKSGLLKKARDIIAKDTKTGRFISGKFGNLKKVELNSYRIFFDVPLKDKARKRLENTLSNLGFKWSAQKGKSGEHIYLTSKYLMRYFDKNCGRGAFNKRIPNFVWNLGKRNLKALYDGLIDSDGYYGKTYESYTTVSKKLVTDIVLLSNLLGYRTSSGYRRNPLIASINQIFKGRIIRDSNQSQGIVISKGNLTSKQISKEKYKGKIWCIKVKNRNFLVERDGKYVFSGNTDEVFGDAPKGIAFKEWDRYNSKNPYAAAKAGGEELCLAYANTYKVPVLISHCHDIETRILTPIGIKKYSDIKIGDKVFALDKDGKIVLSKIKNIISYTYYGEMVAVEHVKISQLMTPEHRILTQKRYGEKKYTYKLAKDLLLLNNDERHYMPTSGNWIGKKNKIIDISSYIRKNVHFNTHIITKYKTEDLMELIGWFVSEGSSNKTGTISIAQTNSFNKLKIFNLLKRMGLNPRIDKQAVQVSSVLLCDFFDMFGKYAENKYIPEFILQYDKKYLLILLEVLILGDGSKHKSYTRYYTQSLKLAEQLLEIAFKCGYSAQFHKRKTWNWYKTSLMESYYISLSNANAGISKKHIGKKKYNNTVWCLETEHGNFAIVRSGKISISGNCMNVFGERQHPEKFIPLIIRKVLNEEVVTIHSDSTKKISGSRFYIHARNVASAILFLLENGKIRDKYNIVGEKEVSNLDMALYIAEIIGKPLKYEMVDFHSSRPGHDLRYALNGEKMKRMGWTIPIKFEDSLRKTIEWTLQNRKWLEF